MVGQVMMPNIYGAVTGGMEDGRVRAAKNALAQAVQQGGPTSPGAMNALSALDPGRAAAMSQQAQQFDASQAQSADQFGQGMDLRTRQFDYGVERDNIGDRRAAASAGAAAGRQRDAASSAAAAANAKKGAALISQVLRSPEANRAAAWQQGLQIARSMGLSVEGLPPEYPGDDAAGVIYSQLSGSAMERPDMGKDPIAALRARAAEAGLAPGTPQYSDFMMQGGRGPGNVTQLSADGSLYIGPDRGPTSGLAPPTVPEGQPKSTLTPGIDFGTGTGMWGMGADIANTVTDTLGAGVIFPEALAASEGLRNLKTRTMTTLAMAVPGRPSNYLLQQFEAMSLTPNEITTGRGKAGEKLRQTESFITSEMMRLYNMLENTEGMSSSAISSAKEAFGSLSVLREDYRAVIPSFTDGGAGGGGGAGGRTRIRVDENGEMIE